MIVDNDDKDNGNNYGDESDRRLWLIKCYLSNMWETFNTDKQVC